ncbi:hypothetical protein [Streptomyces sp. NPDC000618]|uniref:hypothetical protein n=1 Tax=Streptomyces sp. NPDC000618 TaxID=3154265 RepID=UPI0033182F8B
MASIDNMLAALKRERAGYVSRGLDDRVAQVDEEIARLRGDDSPETEEPQGRTATPPQQTADQGTPPTKKTAAKKASATPPAPPTE